MKYKLVGLGVLFLLCWMGCGPPTCRSAESWTDNFNDGTYEPEWTIIVNPRIYDGDYGFSGSNWSAANGYLHMLPSRDDWGIIGLCCNAANGTWSFDIQFNLTQVGTEPIALVNFMGNDLHQLNSENEINNTFIQFRTLGTPPDYDIALRLRKKITDISYTIAENVTAVPGAGWHHIDVTRNTTGYFSVYLNDSLHIQGVDTDIDTSAMFSLWFQTWQMIDNIVLPDDLCPPATLPPPPPFILIVAGVAVAAIVIVIVVILIRRRRS